MQPATEATPLQVVSADSSASQTVFRVITLGGGKSSEDVGRSTEIYNESGQRFVAWRHAAPPRGVVAWRAVQAKRRYHCHGSGRDEICRTSLEDPSYRLRVALFRSGRPLVHTLAPWQKGPDPVAILAVATSAAGDAVLWDSPVTTAPDRRALHLDRFSRLGHRGRRTQQLTPAEYRHGNTAVVTSKGEMLLFQIRLASERRAGGIGIFGFGADNRPQQPRYLEADRPAWPVSATAWKCHDKAMLAFFALSTPRRILELQVIEVTPDGAIRQLGAVWRGSRSIPRDAAALRTEARMAGACHDEQMAIAAQLNSLEGIGLLFFHQRRSR